MRAGVRWLGANAEIGAGRWIGEGCGMDAKSCERNFLAKSPTRKLPLRCPVSFFIRTMDAYSYSTGQKLG